MPRLRTTTTLSLLALLGGIAGTWWFSGLTYNAVPGTHASVSVARTAKPHPPALAKARLAASVNRARHPPVVVPVPADDETTAIEEPALVPVHMPSLRYPMAALRRQHEGEVILRVRVTGGGEVVDVGVSQSSGDADLDRAAEEGIRQWRFARPSDPAGLTADFPVRFQLAATL